jgi:hypothetical protein
MADTDQVLKLAAIIREVDGDHSKGAAALAELILDHPRFHQCCDAPAPPADGEVAELVEWLQEEADDYECIGCEDSAAKCKRVAELLQRLSPPQPVPVSERLPGPEDMTDDGEVWIEDPGREYPLADAGDYDWEPHKWILRPIGKFDAQNGLRWLPAHALPLPEVGE